MSRERVIPPPQTGKGRRGGRRPGSGRRKGALNKATIEQALIADRIVNEAKMAGRKLAKEMLDEFMVMFANMAEGYRPRAGNERADEEKFEKWARLTVETAAKLAPYQSPTYKAIAIVPTQQDQLPRRFTLAIFAKPLPDEPQMIEGEVLRRDDDAA